MILELGRYFYELDKSYQKGKRYGDQKRKSDILKRKSSSHQQNQSKCFSSKLDSFFDKNVKSLWLNKQKSNRLRLIQNT